MAKILNEEYDEIVTHLRLPRGSEVSIKDVKLVTSGSVTKVELREKRKMKARRFGVTNDGKGAVQLPQFV